MAERFVIDRYSSSDEQMREFVSACEEAYERGKKNPSAGITLLSLPGFIKFEKEDGVLKTEQEKLWMRAITGLIKKIDTSIKADQALIGIEEESEAIKERMEELEKKLKNHKTAFEKLAEFIEGQEIERIEEKEKEDAESYGILAQFLKTLTNLDERVGTLEKDKEKIIKPEMFVGVNAGVLEAGVNVEFGNILKRIKGFYDRLRKNKSLPAPEENEPIVIEGILVKKEGDEERKEEIRTKVGEIVSGIQEEGEELEEDYNRDEEEVEEADEDEEEVDDEEEGCTVEKDYEFMEDLEKKPEIPEYLEKEDAGLGRNKEDEEEEKEEKVDQNKELRREKQKKEKSSPSTSRGIRKYSKSEIRRKIREQKESSNETITKKEPVRVSDTGKKKSEENTGKKYTELKKRLRGEKENVGDINNMQSQQSSSPRPRTGTGFGTRSRLGTTGIPGSIGTMFARNPHGPVNASPLTGAHGQRPETPPSRPSHHDDFMASCRKQIRENNRPSPQRKKGDVNNIQPETVLTPKPRTRSPSQHNEFMAFCRNQIRENERLLSQRKKEDVNNIQPETILPPRTRIITEAIPGRYVRRSFVRGRSLPSLSGKEERQPITGLHSLGRSLPSLSSKEEGITITLPDIPGTFQKSGKIVKGKIILKKDEKLSFEGDKTITDEDLEKLAEVKCLQELNLRYCEQLKELKGLGGLSSLRKLDLYYCKKITNEGFKIIGGLENLEILNLGCCDKLTGKGIKLLKGLSSLRRLIISKNQIIDNLESRLLSFITRKGISSSVLNKLEEALPQLTIYAFWSP